MRVAIAQFNPTVGAVQENGRRIQEWMGRAQREGADAVLFPELCVTGYPPRDLLDRPGFVKRVAAVTRELVAAAPADLTVLFGSLGVPEGPGLPLTNDAVVARGGREIARVSKQLLPTYDVFDDARHFHQHQHAERPRQQPIGVAPDQRHQERVVIRERKGARLLQLPSGVGGQVARSAQVNAEPKRQQPDQADEQRGAAARNPAAQGSGEVRSTQGVGHRSQAIHRA